MRVCGPLRSHTACVGYTGMQTAQQEGSWVCDTVVALDGATSKGTVLFAKNSDREYREAQCLDLVPAASHEPGSFVRLTYIDIAQTRRTHRVLLSRPHWIWGAEMGTNEHGLTIGNEAIFSKIEPSVEA